jgi:hypothetical protein
MTGVLVDLVEADFFGIGGGYRACNERKAQKTFPVGTRGHSKYSNATELGFKTVLPRWFRQSTGGVPSKEHTSQSVLLLFSSLRTKDRASLAFSPSV